MVDEKRRRLISSPPPKGDDEEIVIVEARPTLRVGAKPRDVLCTQAITSLFTGTAPWRGAGHTLGPRIISTERSSKSARPGGNQGARRSSSRNRKTKAGRRRYHLARFPGLRPARAPEGRGWNSHASRAWRRKAPGRCPVFASIDGPWGPRPFKSSRAWAGLCRQISMPDLVFHALRHTHASQLIDAGVDIVTISKRLGHASQNITLRIYAHLFQKDDGKAAAAINAALNR